MIVSLTAYVRLARIDRGVLNCGAFGSQYAVQCKGPLTHHDPL